MTEMPIPAEIERLSNTLFQRFRQTKQEESKMPENEVNTNTTTPKRRFIFNGMTLADPDPKMTPQEVAEFHSLLHSELTNVTVKGPTKTADGFDEYTFKTNVGNFG